MNLLACPFCGAEAAMAKKGLGLRRVHCRRCGARGPLGKATWGRHGEAFPGDRKLNEQAEKRAAAGWNMRVHEGVADASGT